MTYMKAEDYPVAKSKHRTLETPLKIEWQQSSDIRARIQTRLHDYCSWNTPEDDDGNRLYEQSTLADEQSEPRAAVAQRTLGRLKTKVVIESVEEATALHNELDWYADGAGKRGITWMNGMMEKSVRRVRSEIVAGLGVRGYTVEYHDTFRGKIYVSDDET